MVAVLLLGLTGCVAAGWLTSVDQFAVDHVMVGLKQSERSFSGWLSVFPIFRPGQHHGHLAVAAVAYAVTFPASLVPAVLLVALPLLTLYGRNRRRRALALAAAFLVANAVEVAGKSLIARPALLLHRSAQPPIRLHTFDTTFPSGHAARALLIAVAVAACLPRLRPLLYGWVAAVAALLVVAGAHAPSDTAGGLLLAALCLLALDHEHGAVVSGGTTALSPDVSLGPDRATLTRQR